VRRSLARSTVGCTKEGMWSKYITRLGLVRWLAAEATIDLTRHRRTIRSTDVQRIPPSCPDPQGSDLVHPTGAQRNLRVCPCLIPGRARAVAGLSMGSTAHRPRRRPPLRSGSAIRRTEGAHGDAFDRAR